MNRLSKQRIYAFLLILGASILLFLTSRMIFVQRAFEILVLWVFILLILEFLVDISCFVSSLRWLISNDERKATIPLQIGATAAILHALRVLIYVLGRTGPWLNFDIKPEYLSLYSFDWFWVWFAATLSVLGIIGVIVIWMLRRRAK
jgi:hypothetical protein